MPLAALVSIVAAMLLWAPASQAAVTSGAPLDLPANNNQGREVIAFPGFPMPPSCTFWGLDPFGSYTSQTPRGQWVITMARVRTGSRVGPMVFTIIQASRSQAGAGGIICCHSPVESQVFTPAPNAVTTLPVRLPTRNTVTVVDGEAIEVVDYLGISALDLTSAIPAHIADPSSPFANSNVSFIAPALRPPREALQDGAFPQTTILINADYEPDADGDGLGDETQDTGGGGGTAPTFSIAGRPRLNRGRGSATLALDLPGPGSSC